MGIPSRTAKKLQLTPPSPGVGGRLYHMYLGGSMGFRLLHGLHALQTAWPEMSTGGKAKFLRAKIREEIFNLPERQPLWRRVWEWLGKVS